MTKIAVGTLNRAKMAAVRAVFSDERFAVVATDAESNVSAQPFSDEETLEGAVNRAKHALMKEGADIGIGLEGGVVQMMDRLWVCNWGALVDRNGLVVSAGGARIPLPPEVAEEVWRGQELGDVMDAYTGTRHIRQKEGAIGVFTNGCVNRTDMFVHIVQLLAGQYEFFSKTRRRRIDESD